MSHVSVPVRAARGNAREVDVLPWKDRIARHYAHVGFRLACVASDAGCIRVLSTVVTGAKSQCLLHTLVHAES